MSDLLKNAMTQYMERVLPVGAGPEQVQETRRAFYSGAHAIMCILQAAPDDDVAIEGMMTDLAEEFQEFLDLVKTGKA